MSDLPTILAFGASAVCTLLCWVRAARSKDILFFKVAGIVIAAVPFIGPVFFLLICMPPRLPAEAQAKQEWSKGVTVRSQITRDLFGGNQKHLNRVYGVSGRAQRKLRESKRGT